MSEVRGILLRNVQNFMVKNVLRGKELELSEVFDDLLAKLNLIHWLTELLRF